jgi:hypothetical protein
VRVIQAADGARLAIKPLPELGVGEELGGKDLDRDLAVESGIAAAVDLAHATGRDRRQYFKVAKSSARRERRHEVGPDYSLSIRA